jgi:hypothetical protein
MPSGQPLARPCAPTKYHTGEGRTGRVTPPAGGRSSALNRLGSEAGSRRPACARPHPR